MTEGGCESVITVVASLPSMARLYTLPPDLVPRVKRLRVLGLRKCQIYRILPCTYTPK